MASRRDQENWPEDRFLTTESDCATVTPQAVPESRDKPKVILEWRQLTESLIEPSRATDHFRDAFISTKSDVASGRSMVGPRGSRSMRVAAAYE